MHKSDGPYPKDAYAELAAVEVRHWWFRARNRLLAWVLAEKAAPFRDFLEVGCGTGFVLQQVRRQFPEARLYATDFYEDGLAVARRRVPTAEFSCVDATTMTERERYDVIGAFDVIEHIERDEAALMNMAAALRRGGHLVLTVPQHMGLWSAIDEMSHHMRRYSRAGLIGKLRSAGLRVVYVTSFVSLLAPLMWLSRRGRPAGDGDLLREFRIGRWLNFCCESAAIVEYLLVRLGVRFPFGGSLLVIAARD